LPVVHTPVAFINIPTILYIHNKICCKVQRRKECTLANISFLKVYLQQVKRNIMVELLFSYFIHIKACIVMRQIITLKKSDEQMSSVLIWLLFLLFSEPNIFPLVAK
jgi:hypothetical protein